MSYVLKHDNEFDRLEYQSTLPNYDYKVELEGFLIKNGDRILDAACGTGVVTRYLGEKYPDSKVVGCDIGELNLEKAKKKAFSYLNINFELQDLTCLNFKDNSFDKIICRYAIQHVEKGKRAQALREILRVLRPGGKFLCIDFDGTLHNIYPRTNFLDQSLKIIEGNEVIDLRIGRKLPYLFNEVKFKNINHCIHVLSFKGNSLEEEVKQLEVRLGHAFEFLVSELGSKKDAEKFVLEFLETFKEEGLVYFYNKFMVTGEKESTLEVVT